VFPAYRWWRDCYPAVALLAGLGAAQIIATVQVYLSNRALCQTLALVTEAGYLAVPNPHITGRLHDPAPAVYGGLFFSLSVGAGISLLSFGAAWVWARFFSRRTGPLIALLVLWALSIAAVNWKGACPLVTAYVVLIPAPVSWITLRWMPPQGRGAAGSSALVHLMLLALLASLWAPRMEGDLFLDLRDRLLLSNPAGVKISDFYYRYTLYPAYVFKSLEQKTLRTCSLDGVRSNRLRTRLQGKLLDLDYLPVEGKKPVHLRLRESDRDLLCENRGRVILKTTVHAFLSRPADVLKRFSSETDRHFLFRQFTFYSVLIGFPVALYVFLRTLLFCLLRGFFKVRTASRAAVILCLLSGVGLLIPMWGGSPGGIDRKHLETCLESDRWQERVAALKTMGEERVDPAGFESYRRLLESAHIPERYWLAKALGVSRSPQTYQDLLHLLDDPSPGVVSMAFAALGRRGESKAVPEILKRLNRSDDWYNQWYAYRALRSLGWKQAVSG